MALDCPAHPFHPGQHLATPLTLPYSTSSSAATLASIDNDEHPVYSTNVLEHISSMQCFPTSHLRGTPYKPPSPAASTSSSMTSSSVTPPSQNSCPSSPTSSASSSSSSSPSLHTHRLDLYSKYAPVPDDEHIPGVRAADGLMTANHPAVRAFLDLAAASPHDLPPPPKDAATFALCALASISTPLHPAHWVFWRESRRTWTSAVVDRVITYQPPLIVIPRDISWLGPEENRCILWLYQSRMRDVYPTLTWWCDSYHPRKQEEGQSERRTRSATAAAATSSTANAGAIPASSSSKSKAKSGGKSRQRAGTVAEDQKQQSQKRVEEENKSEAQEPEKSQPKQADIAVAVAAEEEKVHAGQKRKTPSLTEDTTEGNNEADTGASSAPAKKRARPAMGGKELRALAQAAHFATSGLGRSAHAFAGVSADMFSAASGSSSSPSSSSQPSSSASSKPSSKKAVDESAKAAEEEEESPAQATRVSARQRERRDRAVAVASTTSTAPVAKKVGNNKRVPSSPSVLAASPLSECTPLALSTSISGEQRSPSALATSIDAADNVETENDKEEEEAMNLIPPLLPTPASLPRELPTSTTKRRTTGGGKSNGTTATITSGSGNSNNSNSRTRTRRPSHHERSTSNASTTLSSSSSNTFSSAASVSGESTHTLVADSAALHGRSRSRSLSGQSDVSEATTAVGEQQLSHKRGKVVEVGVPLDSVLFKPVSDLEEDEDLAMEGEEGPDEREGHDNDESGPGRRRREQASTRSSSSSRSRSRSSKRTARPSPKKALLIDEAAAAAVTAAAKKRAARARR